MNKPSRAQAAAVSAGLSLLFVAVYGTCNWITARRNDVGTWYYAWERYIPFVPLFIVPYMSIDLFYVCAPFLCRSRTELQTFARRIVLTILAAGACFLLIPLRMAVSRPPPDGWTGAIFNFLHGFDQPYNLFPSLHITFAAILATFYARHSRGILRWAINLWFSLIGLSTLLTYQHHVVDIIGGIVLATICSYLIPEVETRFPVRPNLRVGFYYGAGSVASVLLALVGWPWTGIMLWPGLSLAVVAAGYTGLGPRVYRKSNGQLPLSARVVLAPCLMGQYLSLLYYRKDCAAWSQVTPSVWIGARLTNREAMELKRQGVTAVLDLTAEFSEVPAFRALRYRNLAVLDLTGMGPSQLWEAVTFIREEAATGIVYVHCKVGYSRTAAAVGAYLLACRLAQTVAQATAILRQARPSIVIRPQALDSLNDFASSLRRRDLWASQVIAPRTAHSPTAWKAVPLG
jgi:protein-tyrosine phosphatase/membrane-associated phospholipid phosphatase